MTLINKTEAVDAEVVKENVPGGICWNEISSKSMGGTELMCRRLESSLDKDLMENFQIIPSRVRSINEEKIRIFYAHDLPHDPESQHLKNEGWRKFHKIVFVSQWQKEWYIREFQIPYSKVVVLQNAITPIDLVEKPKAKINLIYHTTHRGLDILYSVIEKLVEEFPTIHLDVYSSFGIYGWPERDEHFSELFDKIGKHPNMTYHGYKPNDEVRTALQNAHIFAYPNTWMESSCLSLMEAMSAGCACVHPDFGALPETAANWTMMYPFDEDKNRHAGIFYAALKTQIQMLNDEGSQMKLQGAKNYADLFYNWKIRQLQWKKLLEGLIELKPERKIEQPQEVFQYRSYG